MMLLGACAMVIVVKIVTKNTTPQNVTTLTLRRLMSQQGEVAEQAAEQAAEEEIHEVDDGSTAEHWSTVPMAVRALTEGVGQWQPCEGEPPQQREPARRVGLSGVALGPAECAALAKALATAAPRLEKVMLRRNDVAARVSRGSGRGLEKMGAVGIGVIAEALRGAELLEACYVVHNGIGDRGAAALAEALAGKRSLRRLCLQSNGIGNAGAARLASILPSLPSLELLDVSENEHIGQAGMRAIARALHGRDPPVSLGFGLPQDFEQAMATAADEAGEEKGEDEAEGAEDKVGGAGQEEEQGGGEDLDEHVAPVDMPVCRAARAGDARRLRQLLAEQRAQQAVASVKAAAKATAVLDVCLRGTAVAGRVDMVRLLLEHGAAVNSAGDTWDGYGQSGTALVHAARHGHLKVVEALLAHGADARGTYGTLALRAGHLVTREIKQLLSANGAKYA